MLSQISLEDFNILDDRDASKIANSQHKPTLPVRMTNDERVFHQFIKFPFSTVACHTELYRHIYDSHLFTWFIDKSSDIGFSISILALEKNSQDLHPDQGKPLAICESCQSGSKFRNKRS